MFKLIFTGELIAGFEQSVVEKNLAELLKQAPADVRQKLFAGKAVVVKRVDTEQLAHKWQQAFARAGAVLVIDAQNRKAESPQSEEQPVEPSVRIMTDEPSLASARARAKAAGPRNRAYLWLGLIALVLIVVTVSVLWLTRPLWQSVQLPENQRGLANALAMEGIYALGHVHVGRVRALESLAGSETDLGLPGGEGFWDSLAAAGLNPRRDIEHLWLASFYSEQTPTVVMAASGSFDVERLSAWLAERYRVQSQDAQGIVFTRLNESTCEQGAPMLAHIHHNQLLVGEPSSVRAVLQRMQSGATAEIDLGRWESVSAGQVATLAILVPENMGRGIGGMSGLVVQGISHAAGPAEGLYVGADTVALPPGIELSLLVASADQAFIEQTYTAVNSSLGQMRAEAARSWPEVASIYDRLSVQKRADGVRATARFDKHLKRDIGNWVNAFMGSLFSSPGFDPGEESIDENPPVYAQAASTGLPRYSDYRHIPHYFFTPALETGPFALGVNTLEVDDAGKVAIKMVAEAYDLPNLPSRGAAVKFFVESVVDVHGQSLLAEIECGPDINREAAAIGNVMASSYYRDNGESVDYVRLYGDKTLNLPAGVSVENIAEIRGRISYAETVALERMSLRAPLTGQSVEAHGVKVRFLGGDAHSLRYQVSGDTDRLLHIYARNQAGQPLNSSSSMGGSGLFGSGKTYTVNYRGTIASVELVIAREQQLHTIPFVLETVYPASRTLDHIEPQEALFNSQQWPLFVASTPPEVTYSWREPVHELDAGPLRIAVTDLDTGGSFGFTMKADIYAQNTFALRGGLATGELRITQLQQADGTLHPGDLDAYFAFDHDGGYRMNGVYQPDARRPWFKGSVNIRARDLKIQNISQLHGHVNVKMATGVYSHKLPFSFAQKWKGQGLSLKVSKWESGKLTLNYQGDLSQLVAIKAYRGDELISQPATVQQMFGDAYIVLEIDGVPTDLEIDMADEFVHEQFPFVLVTEL